MVRPTDVLRFLTVQMMSELVRKAEVDIEGLRQRLAEAGAAGGELSSCSRINASHSAQLLHAARSLGGDDMQAINAAAAAATGAASPTLCAHPSLTASDLT